MLLVLGCDGMLGLLLHSLHKVLHVLKGIDLGRQRNKYRQEVCVVQMSVMLCPPNRFNLFVTFMKVNLTT